MRTAPEHVSTKAPGTTGRSHRRPMIDVTSGKPLAGVTVSMTGAAAVRTDSLGRFAFPSLASSRYTLRVQHDGHTPVRGAAVNLLAGQLVTDVELRVGRHG